MLLLLKIIEFLLSIVFNLFCMLVLIRLYMQLAKVSFANPVGQLTLKLTNWLVLPFQRLLPNIKRFDLPSFLAAYLCSIIHILLLFFIGFLAQQTISESILQTILFIAIASILNLAKLLIYIINALIIIQVLLSWIQPTTPAAWYLRLFSQQMTKPVLNPIQQRLPQKGIFAQIDFSPFIALVILQLILITINHFMPL